MPIIIGGPAMNYNLNKVANTVAFNLAKPFIRKRLYDNLLPYNYGFTDKSAKQRVIDAVLFNKSEYGKVPAHRNKTYNNPRDVTFATYLGIDPKDRHTNKPSLTKSNYMPSIRSSNNTYYKHPNLVNNKYNKNYINKAVAELVSLGLPLSEGKNIVSDGILSDVFGSYTVGKGYDNKGSYVSYYDLWDLAPKGDAGKKDESKGLGTPVNFYDRIHLDDVMGLNKDAIRGTHWLPEVIVNAENPKFRKGVHSKEWYRTH